MRLWLLFKHQLENTVITKTVTTSYINIEYSHRASSFIYFFFLFLLDMQEIQGESCSDEVLHALPQCIFWNSCLSVVNIADYLSCYIRLTEACYGDSRVADILYLSILGWGSYHIQQLLWLVSTIQCKQDVGCNVTPIPFRYFERFYENSNVSCRIGKTTQK